MTRCNVLQVKVKPGDDEQDTDDEADMKLMAAMASRGRRSAVVAPKLSQKRKPSIDKRTNP